MSKFDTWLDKSFANLTCGHHCSRTQLRCKQKLIKQKYTHYLAFQIGFMEKPTFGLAFSPICFDLT